MVHLVLPSKESSGATNRVQSNTGTTGVLVRAQIAERGGVGPSCASCLTEEERTSALDRGKPITFGNKRNGFQRIGDKKRGTRSVPLVYEQQW